jgi:hypothetical protein
LFLTHHDDGDGDDGEAAGDDVDRVAVHAGEAVHFGRAR